jgi:F0F1-type ATP synthase assembly protein I
VSDEGGNIMNTDKIIAEKIASEYTVKTTSKLEALKKLDRKAKQTAEIVAYTLGVIAALVLGTGMSLSMGVIGDKSITSMIIGIIVGLIGIFGVSINYFIYKKLIAKGKMKYGSDIIRLAKSISEE